MKPKISAVIDIGSNELRLHIAQVVKFGEKNEGEVKYLERLSYPLSLGRDTFHMGKLSFDKVDKACDIINNFIHVAASYGVSNVRTIASTAMREAKNHDYIIDQIKIKTGVDVHIMDDLEEKKHLYKLITHYAEDMLKESAVIVYIGSGSLGVSLFVEGKMPQTWNIRVGSMRMGELFGQMQEYTKDFYRLMEEYLAGYTDHLLGALPSDIEHFIVCGQEIELIAKLAMNEQPSATSTLFEVPVTDFNDFYNTIKSKSADKIAMDYHLNPDKADALLPAACIYHNLLNCTHAAHITASRLLPCDALLFEELFPKKIQLIDKRFDKGTHQSVRRLAEQHGADISHGEIVRDFALTIFDRIKKVHGLGSRDKLLLTVASVLHDIGECINKRDHHEISYEIVRNLDIVGLTQKELQIAAIICRYHSFVMPDLTEPYYQELDSDTKVKVSKLAAMLRIADALDRSHTQKYKQIEAKLVENALIITVETDKNVNLEVWAFAQKAQFFEDVFGIKAQLKIKNKKQTM